MNLSGTGPPERELRSRKGSRTLESHLLGERSNKPEKSPDAEKSVAVSWSTEKPIKNPTDELRAQSPKIEMPGWGLGTESSAPEVSPRARGGRAERKLLGRSRNKLMGQRLPGRLENKAVEEEGNNT